MFNPNTAVNREGDAAKERENTSQRTASICGQAQLRLGLEDQGRCAAATTCASSKLTCRKFAASAEANGSARLRCKRGRARKHTRLRQPLTPIPHPTTLPVRPPSLICAPFPFPPHKMRQNHTALTFHDHRRIDYHPQKRLIDFGFITVCILILKIGRASGTAPSKKSSNPKPPSGGIFLSAMQRERRSLRPGQSCPLADMVSSGGRAPPRPDREGARDPR